MISNAGIANNLYGLYEGLAKRGLVSSGSAGSFEFIRHDGFEWPNMAYRRGGAGRPIGGEDIRLLKEAMLLRGCPRLVILHMEELTPEIQGALASERFIPATEWVNMAIPVAQKKAERRNGLECRVIDAENPEEWGQWAGVVSEVLFKGGRLDPVLFRDPELKKRFVLMAGYVEGVPVATCLLYLGGNGDLAESGDLGGSTGLGGSAGMYMIATLPSSQGRGFGRQLVEQAQAEAAERGYGFVVLHSTKAGFDFYSRLGYGTFGKLVLYYSISFR